MSQKPIREYAGKRLIKSWLNKHASSIPSVLKQDFASCLITPETDLESLESPFPDGTKLVVKPDQFVKRRGKLGLVKLNVTWAEAIEWVKSKRNKELRIGNSVDNLNYFLIEQFVPHTDSEEHYICIRTLREGDEIMFCEDGGIDVGDVDEKALRLLVKVGDKLDTATIEKDLLSQCTKLEKSKHELISTFILNLFNLFVDLHFSYLEINPLIVLNDLSNVVMVDLAAILDSAAEHECHSKWADFISFPPVFGHRSRPEEQVVEELDSRTGASLKLTILNEYGKVWNLIAGGGASVIYADTVADLGYADQLGNYGEYSGAPSATQTYQYAATVIQCMLRHPISEEEKARLDAEGQLSHKVLLIGGAIANFTDVADTFKGIIQALLEYKTELNKQNTHIFIRRGGPNWQTGLRLMQECAVQHEFKIKVFGPETHMTAIVSMALLGLEVKEPKFLRQKSSSTTTGPAVTPTPEPMFDESVKETTEDLKVKEYVNSFDLSHFKWDSAGKDDVDAAEEEKTESKSDGPYTMTNGTRSLVYGMQTKAVQNMLDFDYICRRKVQSVAGIVYEFAPGRHHSQFYWGSKEIMVPVYKTLKDALSQHADVDTIVNFASSRSAYPTTLEMLEFEQVKHITIIAEGVPERHARHLYRLSKEKNVIILGPSTVGGIKPGCFRIGNSGGMLDNIIASDLHRPGCVGFVSKSGGLSNELSNIISSCTNGVFEGMAIGGDRFPISTFMDNLMRFEKDELCKILVVLGELGGELEYEICDAINNGLITKPVVAWCTGTCANLFKHEVQFGHAGAKANSTRETAKSKNEAMRRAGCLVPTSFDDFGRIIKYLYLRLVKENIIKESMYQSDIEPPPIPVDYQWARKLGLVRKPAGFLSTITDERGEELIYAGMPISEVFSQSLGVGGVIGLLWFRRRLPDWCNRFIEICLQLVSDHGPAVSGAHNTIVAARAGKDLISSLCSGLLTIGPRFGGALDGAAKMFSQAYDDGLTPLQFVTNMRKQGKLIMGIGHKIKSLENPDKRVELVLDFVKNNFPTNGTGVTDFALRVQELTTRKKTNLILNVDGAIACAFVDLMRNCGCFSKEEASQYIQMGSLNAIFVLGRSIGLIGHFLDQKRLGQGLYRHPTDDITYFLQDLNAP